MKQILQNKSLMLIIMFGGFILLILSSITVSNKKEVRPNIIVIMADDMGYSDLGCYGSEIETPNLDKLASEGLKYTQFYNTARCCPTRASLLTGLYPHQTGLGWMTKVDLGRPGYKGEINSNCVTLGEVLKQSGYSTYVSGKWHVNKDEECDQDSPKHNWPLQRGFDKFYGILKGASDYFRPTNLYSGNKHIQPGSNYYFTDAVNDSSCSFIESHISSGKENPFFLYVAHYAPHWPIQAKEEDIKKYQGKYLEGWDVLREKRLAKMKKLNLIDDDVILSGKTRKIENWDDLSNEKKKEMDKRMAIYAAQIDNMDQGIGRILSTLEKNDQLENTLILFLSDNGGCMQPISRGVSKETKDLGTAKSLESYGISWANVSNTPYRYYKKWAHEGGISTPFIVHWPNGIEKKGEIRNQQFHVIDIMPTLLEISKTMYPEQYSGNKIIPYEGVSIVNSFENKDYEKRPLFWEHIANRGVRYGDWKLVSLATKNYPFTSAWELYNLKDDRIESINLADKFPEKVNELEQLWEEWGKRANVSPVDGRAWGNRNKDPIDN
ncbi:MAG: arylsulfatase [Melioribacteraceae bacterium]|nr:arylsulfatase [Melioribacteraceae bacterium]